MEHDQSSIAGDGAGDAPDALESILDLFVYAPLGLALSARRLWPELVRTGRREAETQLRTARVVGSFVVQMGRAQGPRMVRDVLGGRPGGDASDDARGRAGTMEVSGD